MKSKPPIVAGVSFHSWTTTGRRRPYGNTYNYEVRCVCGYVGFRQRAALESGRVKHCRSCGLRQRFASRFGKIITDATLRYRWNCRWFQMLQRCYNPNHARYEDYGGRGIRVHQSLRSFDGFCRFIKTLRGWKRDGRQNTLDRIDNDKGYHPGNLRLATQKQQARNRRDA